MRHSGELAADDLVREAAQGNASSVRKILEKYPGEVDRRVSGKTALQVACHQGHTDVVEILLGAHADLESMDDDGDTPLHYCCFGYSCLDTCILCLTNYYVHLFTNLSV
jgi:ankyrin repeat protein